MPLLGQHRRDGELLTHKWSWFTFAALERAAEVEGVDLNAVTSHTFKHNHIVVDKDDGEEFEILAGDEVVMWRGMR